MLLNPPTVVHLQPASCGLFIFSPAMQNYLKLRRRQQLFVDAYVQCGVGSAAMRLIGSKGKYPDRAAYNLLQIPEVAAAIEERQAEAIAAVGVTTLRILEELACVAFFNPKDLCDESGNLRPIQDWPENAARAIIGMDVEQLFDGNGKDRARIGSVFKPRAGNKNDALKLLGQFKKMWTEKHEHAGPGGAPLQPPHIAISFPDGGPGSAAPAADDGVETS